MSKNAPFKDPETRVISPDKLRREADKWTCFERERS